MNDISNREKLLLLVERVDLLYDVSRGNKLGAANQNLNNKQHT